MIQDQSQTLEVHNVPFDKGQLNVRNLLICKNTQTGESQIRMISQADAGFFFSKLKEERDANKPHEIDVTLYNLTLGAIQSNVSTNVDEKELIDDTVRKKIVEAKFFNGESLYTPEEMDSLKAWILEKGAEKMNAFS